MTQRAHDPAAPYKVLVAVLSGLLTLVLTIGAGYLGNRLSAVEELVEQVSANTTSLRHLERDVERLVNRDRKDWRP